MQACCTTTCQKMMGRAFLTSYGTPGSRIRCIAPATTRALCAGLMMVVSAAYATVFSRRALSKALADSSETTQVRWCFHSSARSLCTGSLGAMLGGRWLLRSPPHPSVLGTHSLRSAALLHTLCQQTLLPSRPGGGKAHDTLTGQQSTSPPGPCASGVGMWDRERQAVLQDIVDELDRVSLLSPRGGLDAPLGSSERCAASHPAVLYVR